MARFVIEQDPTNPGNCGIYRVMRVRRENSGLLLEYKTEMNGRPEKELCPPALPLFLQGAGPLR